MPIALAAGLEAIPGYRCVRRLGRSSRGETWLMQTEDDASRVLKWVIDGAGLRHARKLTNYRHPFLINWERCELDGADLYLIADCAEDTLAAQFLERQTQGEVSLQQDVLFRYLEELAEVLDYLHVKHQLLHGHLSMKQVGLQHRHIKLLNWGLHDPEKIQESSWKLSDLVTTAPEVLLGLAEPASDQFSLAALYVEASTGQPALTATSFSEFFRLRSELTLDGRQLGESERQVLSRAMHPDPASRYPTCAAFVKALHKSAEPVKSTSKAGIQLTPTIAPAAEQVVPVETTWPEAAPAVPEGQVQVPTVILKSLVAVEGEKDNRHPDSAFLNLNNLAYHSKVQSHGILTPTMVLALGRHGHTVLHELSKLCHDRFDGIETMPHLRVIAIDQEAGTGAHKPGMLAKEHVFSCPLPQGELLQKARKPEHVKHWLPAEVVPNSNGDATPALNRLSLHTQYEQLRQRLRDECKLMLQSDSLMKSRQHTGLTIRQDLTPTCYLIAGLDEGASTGMLADVAYLIRNTIAESGWGNGKVIGLFLLPGDDASDVSKSLAYASLVELNHYTLEQHFTASYTRDESIESQLAPFDEAFFRKLPAGPADSQGSEAYRPFAEWLMRDLTTELGSLRQASRDATRAFASHASPWFSHGLTTLHSSHDNIRSSLKDRLTARLIGHWLDPDEEMTNVLRADGEGFLRHHIHTGSALLERFQHMCAIVLGCEPAHLIDEWIAPLRKGAAARPPLEALAQDIMQKVEYYFGTSAGYQHSAVLIAIQQEAEAIAQEVDSLISPFIMQYLDKPGMRLGAAMTLSRMLLEWVNHHLNELQANHLEIHQDMLRAERTITQMTSQEERSFAIMGRQRLVSQIAQDLMDYPSRVLKEDLFARAVHVFQHIKKTVEDVIRKLQPADKKLRELKSQYQSPIEVRTDLLLDGESTLEDRVKSLLEIMPQDVYLKLDGDLTDAMARFQSNYADVCMGKGPDFPAVLQLLDNSMEEALDGMLPSEDAAEQLLTLPSQAVVEQLRQCYRDARPDLMENKRSRQGAFCLMLTPSSDSGQELLQMAQATLPQIVAAPEGQPGEILMYRETGCLLPHEIYPQGREAYDARSKNRSNSPHSRFDITFWHALASSPPNNSPLTPSSLDLPDEHKP